MTAHTITLPGPAVTRSVTWEQVRAYLTAEGWTTSVDAPVHGEAWYDASRRHLVWVGEEHSIESVVNTLARLASVSPGEMLARIADGPPAREAMPERIIRVEAKV